jgi:membrane protein YqaA with SNARE-associated domain
MISDLLALLLACGGCFALTTLSAVFPWVNAEFVVLSFTTAASSPAAVALLIVVAAAGQMTGKLVLYSAGQQSWRLRSPGFARQLERWQSRCTANPRHADRVVLMSSVVGFPPFIMSSLLAGAVRMNLARFLIAGAIGRLVRFGGVALAGNLVMRAF